MHITVEVNGKKLVLGMEWSKLAGEKPAAAARKLSQTRNCPMGLLWSVSVNDPGSEGSDQVIHSVGLMPSKAKGVMYSGAAALAKSKGSIIGIENLGDDKFWLVATESGRVLPGYDTVTNELDVKRKLADLAQDVEIDYMQLYMDEGTSELFGFPETIAQNPLSLIDADDVDDSMRLRKMQGIPRAAYMGAGIVIILGGLFGYTKYTEVKKARELQLMIEEEEWRMRNLEEQRRIQAASQKPDDPELLRLARLEEINWLRDDFNKVNLLPTIKQMMVLLDTLPAGEYSGWTLDQIMFQRQDSGTIFTTWSRGTGSPATLKKILGNRASIGFTPSFDKASAMFNVQLGSRGYTDIMSVVKDTGVNHQDLVSQLVNHGIEFEASINPQKARRQAIEGLSDNTLEYMSQLGLSSRNFTFKGESLAELLATMTILEKADNLLLEGVVFSGYWNEFTWEIEGNLYE